MMVECFPLAERDMVQVGDDKWLLDTVVCGMGGVQGFVLTTEGAKIVGSEELGMRN